jgi:hypothetical protein
MDIYTLNSNFSDFLAGTGLLLFTGTEFLPLDNIAFELITKFGVIAVLWFWLRDMKMQMKEVRQDHQKQIDMIIQQQKEFNDRIDKIIKEKE